MVRKKRPEKVERIVDSEEPLKRRMMDSRDKDKEEVYELREHIFDQVEEKPKEKRKVFRTVNDRFVEGRSDHVIEFGKLQKLKSERDLEEAKKKFVSLKEPLPKKEKSYKVIQNKNSKSACNRQSDCQFCRASRSSRSQMCF